MINFKESLENIVIENTKHFKEVLAKAVENESVIDLVTRFIYLDNYGENNNQDKYNRIYIYPDGNDFYFIIKKFDKQTCQFERYMNGGIIYHSYNNSWGIHT